METPSLSLSDIMHPMSPSPTPQLCSLSNVASEEILSDEQRASTPEPLHEGDISEMRRKIAAMGLLNENPSATQNEKELVNMVSSHCCRLGDVC